MKHLTTQKHYEKYKAMAERAGVSLRNSDTIFGTKEKLLALYEKDNVLNNIPLRVFDALFYAGRMFLHLRRHGPMSLAENTCMYKHLIIFEILGMTPEFASWQETIGKR